MQLVNEDNRFIDGQRIKKMFIVAHKYFEKYKDEINSLNVYPVPDGDTGTNMGLTLKAAVEGIISNDNDHIGEVVDLAADSALMGARGNSGVILSQLLRGCARGLRGKRKATPLDISKAFQYGVVYAYRSVSMPVEGTILTVAREMAKGAKKASREYAGLHNMLIEAVESGTKAVERTKEQLPVLREAGVVDAGGQGLLVIIKSFQAAFNGEIDSNDLVIEDNWITESLVDMSVEEEKTLTFPFCTELIVKGTNLRTTSLRKELQPMGDSLIVAGDDDLVKIHIHTNHPGEILELCIKRGTIHDIKIDNMLDQHRKRHFVEVSKIKQAEEKAEGINLITVCNGPGIQELFQNLGAAKVISGGPTMNPQVKDFVQALREFEGPCIILPNDKNIRLAAEQAAQLINKDVRVIPVENIPQGLAAAMAFVKDVSLEHNLDSINRHIEDIKSGEVTFAVRQGTYQEYSFKENDILGIIDGKIADVGEKPEDVVVNLVTKMADEDSELITIIYGNEINEEQADQLKTKLGKDFPEHEIELIWGGQPLYYYLISVE